MPRPKRKYILFLVEGYTDINVLSAGILDLFEKYSEQKEYEIKFCTKNQGDQIGGDITSENGISPENIEQMISKLYIDSFLQKNPYIYPKEISEIIHIIDMDGAFINDEEIILMPEQGFSDRTFYGSDGIYAINIASIRTRNQRKRENIQKLVSMDKIVIRPKNHRNTKTVKYSVYYFSCNMDHYIHGDANLRPAEKVRKSDDFVLECYDNIDRFCKRLCEGQGAMKGFDYADSWEFIMKRDLSSLERHTNINILIDRIKNGGLSC